MSTIILTSSGKFITSYNVDYVLPKKITDSKIAYIITASKKVPRIDFIHRHKKSMDELGFSYTEIDIDGKNAEELKRELTGYDVVIVDGGNTFYLLKAIRESGFADVIKSLIAQGVVYIGSSAGSYVACPSIIMATFRDMGYDRCGLTDYAAMNLVPFLMMAHYTEDQLELLKEKRKGLQYPLHILNDEQALLIKDGDVQLLGAGVEIVL